jgi:hypothetical protein
MFLSVENVAPAKAGGQDLERLDSRLRGNDSP